MSNLICQVCGHRSPASTDHCVLCHAPAAVAQIVPVRGEPLRASTSEVGRPMTEPLAGLAQAAPVAAMASQTELEGTVLQVYGPSNIDGTRDWWRLGSTLLLVASLLPFFVGLWVLLAVARLALGILGLGMGGGRGLFSEILTFHLLGTALQRPDPVPAYDYVLDSGGQLVSVRQEGEFQESRNIELGCPLTGEIELAGLILMNIPLDKRSDDREARFHNPVEYLGPIPTFVTPIMEFPG